MIRQPADTGVQPQPLSSRRMLQFGAAGVVGGIVFPLVASLLKLYQLHMPVNPLTLLSVQQLEPVLWITDTAPLFLGMAAGLAGRQQDRLIAANKVLTERELEVSSIRSTLETSVLERTRELDERNAQMRSVIGFARQIADAQDLSGLLEAAVQALRERFDQYDVNLFLVDSRGQAAILQSSSTAEGKTQALNGYRIPLGDPGPVARVARRGKMLMSAGRPAAGEQAPSQIVLPLTVHGRVIGALDLRQASPRAVSQNEIDVLQLVADQLAVSIESVRQTGEVRATANQLESVTAEATRSAWQQYLKRNSLAYQYTPAGVRAISVSEFPSGAGTAGIPLVLRGQQIGSISLRKQAGDKLAPTEQDLLEKVAAQVALALENVRLLEETRRRAAQEQLIGEISARFSRSLDVDALLQAAAREFAALPEVAEATVVLKTPEAQGLESPNGSM